MWQQWLNAILGLWVIAAPFVGITGAAFVWTLAITGVIIAVLGVWGALQERNLEEELQQLQFQHR